MSKKVFPSQRNKNAYLFASINSTIVPFSSDA